MTAYIYMAIAVLGLMVSWWLLRVGFSDKRRESEGIRGEIREENTQRMRAHSARTARK